MKGEFYFTAPSAQFHAKSISYCLSNISLFILACDCPTENRQSLATLPILPKGVATTRTVRAVYLIIDIISHRLVYCQPFFTDWCILVYMSNDYKKRFAENLKFLIGDMSINEFSKKIGIPQQTISRYLLCQREISLEYLCKIADYFDEDIDFLIGRKQH